MKNVPIHVEINNFQSIASVNFEIKGFVVVVGKTNTGKSALIRAISSCLLNLPVVGSVRKGTSHTTLRIQNGENDILWEKGEKKINRYTINGKLYDKVERKQLPDIASMGFGSIEVGDSRMQPWWASQFEPIFLLNKTGPQVTDFISEVSRLQVVQDAITLSARGKKRENDQVKECDSNLIEVEDEIEKFEALDKLDSLWSDIKAERESILEYESRIDQMKSLFSVLQKSKERIEIIRRISEAQVPGIDLSLQLEMLSQKRDFFNKLRSLTKQILYFRQVSEIKDLDPPTEEYERLKGMRVFSSLPALSAQVRSLEDVQKVSIPTHDLSMECDKLREMKSFHKEIKHHVNGIHKFRSVIPAIPDLEFVEEESSRISCMQGFNRAILENKKEISKLELESQSINQSYDSVTEELSEFSSCPLCGQELNHEHSPE